LAFDLIDNTYRLQLNLPVEDCREGVTVGVSLSRHDASWVRGFRPGTTDPQWLLSTG